MAVIAGASASSPSRVSSWNVILRMKLSTFTPLQARAQPPVGSV